MHSWIPQYSPILWKWWLAMLTGRRSFLPMLGIIYLSLPNATVQEIGFYTASGQLLALLLQLPIGLLADKIGVQRVLLIGKISLVFSSACYAFGSSFWWFFIGAIAMSFGAHVCTDGNILVWLKQYLVHQKKGEDYKYIASSARGEVSLMSSLIIVLLPLFSVLDIRAPLYFALFIDIIGFLVVSRISFIGTRLEKLPSHNVSFFSFLKTLVFLINSQKKTGFFGVLIFVATIEAVIAADSAFRVPYLISIGFSIPFIGLVLGGSRVVWFLVAKLVPYIEKIFSFRQMIIIDTVFFPFLYFLASFLTNPYLVGFIFAMAMGYMWGRGEIYTDVLFKK